ncbi:hypothetical protein HDV05_008139 [Chytridiales sp. JEL 0842]|nr:hypothetical protein HDV05_008139 [Chytridiales sp. JEL 0842]
MTREDHCTTTTSKPTPIPSTSSVDAVASSFASLSSSPSPSASEAASEAASGKKPAIPPRLREIWKSLPKQEREAIKLRAKTKKDARVQQTTTGDAPPQLSAAAADGPATAANVSSVLSLSNKRVKFDNDDDDDYADEAPVFVKASQVPRGSQADVKRQESALVTATLISKYFPKSRGAQQPPLLVPPSQKSGVKPILPRLSTLEASVGEDKEEILAPSTPTATTTTTTRPQIDSITSSATRAQQESLPAQSPPTSFTPPPMNMLPPTARLIDDSTSAVPSTPQPALNPDFGFDLFQPIPLPSATAQAYDEIQKINSMKESMSAMIAEQIMKEDMEMEEGGEGCVPGLLDW